MKQIYDCFTFYNEFDLLELRLTELYNKVDHFVLVEANTTFTNKPKPFYFEENKQRYAKWLDKIIHIKVDDMPLSTIAWDNEAHQRNAILRGVVDADDNDLIIITDLDEVVRAEAIDYMRDSESEMFALRMPIFNFKLNYMKTAPDLYPIWGMAGNKHLFDHITPEVFRGLRFQFMGATESVGGCQVVEHGGWHFGYLGNKEWLIDKAQSFSHTEVNTPEFIAQIDPEASIAKRTSWKQDSQDQYKIVNVDTYLPRALLDNLSQYGDYILDNTECSAFDLLPTYKYNQ